MKQRENESSENKEDSCCSDADDKFARGAKVLCVLGEDSNFYRNMECKEKIRAMSIIEWWKRSCAGPNGQVSVE